jgi:hypothetical protein
VRSSAGEQPPASLVAAVLDPRTEVGPAHLGAALDDRVEVREVVPGEAAADRYVAPGGWRRALVGFLIGLLGGTIVALLLPRDDGPRRRDLRANGLPAVAPTDPGGVQVTSAVDARGDHREA